VRAGEPGVVGDGVDHAEPHRRSLGEGHGHRPVELDDGRRCHPGKLAVERGDLRPVGVRPRRRGGVQSGDGGLELVGARPAAQQRPLQLRGALGDADVIPAAAVLVLEQHQVAAVRHPGVAPAVLHQHQRQQAPGFRLVGHELDDQPAQPGPLVAQLAADQLVPGRGRVSLREHQVDAGQHRGQSLWQQVGRRHPEGDGGGADLGLGPHQPLRDRGLGSEEGPGDLRGLQPAHQAQREGDLGGGGKGGVAAREDQPQLVVRRLWLGLLARLERVGRLARVGIAPIPRRRHLLRPPS
jgi:hypothetical protein